MCWPGAWVWTRTMIGYGGRLFGRFPFDPRRRRMSVVIDREVLVKGAPDAVLPLCAAAPGAREAVDDLTGRGLRVLAVATRAVDVTSIPQDAGEAESDLRLLGLLALEDPPRRRCPCGDRILSTRRHRASHGHR